MASSIASSDLTALAMLGGQILLVVGGLLLIVQQRRWAVRFIVAGIALVITAAAVPGLAASFAGAPVSRIEWQWAAALVAALAGAFRQWGAAFAFASPLVMKLFVWPALSGLPMIVLVVLGSLLAVGALSRTLGAIWGPELASHVVGTYVVRFIDALFALPWMIASALLGIRRTGQRGARER